MKSLSPSPKILAAMIAMTLASLGAVHAQEVEMDVYSITPPAGWHSEWDKARRLISTKAGLPVPPMLIIESCKTGSGDGCPSACDLAAIQRSGFATNPARTFTLAERKGRHTEYEASEQIGSSQGTGYASFRMLCGPTAFLHAALVDTSSAQEARRNLDAVLATIKWKQ